jgi:protein-disulfide isomerase
VDRPTAIVGLITVIASLCATPVYGQAEEALLPQRTKGSAEAPVTVYEMSDFQCPYCRRHAVETFPELERLFILTGKVRWVFLNLPLTSIHPNAAAAAEFAMCSARAGKFWPIHDLLYKYQEKWAPLKEPGPFLLTLADSVGLPRSALLPCLEKGETRALVKADAEGAARSGASSTPSFYIEGGLMAGAAPLEEFKRILDSIYQDKVRSKR